MVTEEMMKLERWLDGLAPTYYQRVAQDALAVNKAMLHELPFEVRSNGGCLMARTKFHDEAANCLRKLRGGAQVFWEGILVYTLGPDGDAEAGRHIQMEVRAEQNRRVAEQMKRNAEELGARLKKEAADRLLYDNHIQASGFNCSDIIFSVKLHFVEVKD